MVKLNLSHIKLKQLLRKIELWFDIHVVYFLYNDKKLHRYYEYLNKKWDIKK
jgi:hypothetical protein